MEMVDSGSSSGSSELARTLSAQERTRRLQAEAEEQAEQQHGAELDAELAAVRADAKALGTRPQTAPPRALAWQPEAEPQPEEADRPATAPTEILYGVPGAENVAVVCRVRPHSERELASEVVATDNGDAPFLQYTADGRGIMLARAHVRHDFHFTRVGCQPRLSSSSAPADSPAGSPLWRT
jgi:hypothetical protein